MSNLQNIAIKLRDLNPGFAWFYKPKSGVIAAREGRFILVVSHNIVNEQLVWCDPQLDVTAYVQPSELIPV